MISKAPKAVDSTQGPPRLKKMPKASNTFRDCPPEGGRAHREDAADFPARTPSVPAMLLFDATIGRSAPPPTTERRLPLPQERRGRECRSRLAGRHYAESDIQPGRASAVQGSPGHAAGALAPRRSWLPRPPVPREHHSTEPRDCCQMVLRPPV